jgi:hypothetical protein
MQSFLWANTTTRNAFFILLTIALLLVSNVEAMRELIQHRYYVYEQDAYMHLVIAKDMMDNKSWYRGVNPRINAPWGADTHGWTNAVNAILISGTWILSFVLPASRALYLWGFFLPVIFYGFAAWAMLWAVKILQPSFYQQLFILIAFLVNPLLKDYFLPLRVDYDFLLIPLAIVYWGYLLRLICDKEVRFALLAGISASLGLWTSISFALPVFFGLAFLLWLSFIRKEIHVNLVLIFLMTLCIANIVIIRLEHKYFFTPAHDILSIVHGLFFLLLTLALAVYSAYFEKKRLALKVFFICFAAAILFMVMNKLFPGFYQGPYRQVDPLLLKQFFPSLSEFLSPFFIDRSLALSILFYFIIGAGYCYYLHLSKGLALAQLFFLYVAAQTTLLALFMYRWVEYAIPLTILLASFFMKDRQNLSSFTKGLFLMGMIAMPSAIFSLRTDYFLASQRVCEQQLYSMLQNHFLEQAQFNQDKIIFSHSNYGPLLLYSTRFSIIATNDHHNPEGLKDSIRFFQGDEANARNMVMRRNIDLILLCPASYPSQFNPNKVSWLVNIALPKDYSAWRLYRRKK